MAWPARQYGCAARNHGLESANSGLAMLQPRPLASQSQQALLHRALAALQTIPPWLALASPPRPVPAELLKQLKPRRTAVVAQRDAVGAAPSGQTRQLVLQRRLAQANPGAVKQARTPEALLATPVVQQAGPGPGRKLDTPPPDRMIHRALRFVQCTINVIPPSERRRQPLVTRIKKPALTAPGITSQTKEKTVYSVTQRGRVSMSGCRMSSSCSRVSKPWASTTSATLLPLAWASAATRVAAS